MKFRLDREAIAMRVAKEFHDGQCVNLGVGIGTLTSSFLPEDKTIMLHSENGIIGFGRVLHADEMDQIDLNLANPGGQFVTPKPGMSFCSECEAFAMVRGGHVDVAVLGAHQVSQEGDLANWMFPRSELPSSGVPVLGGAMDIAIGAKQVIVAMTHTTKTGLPKIVRHCTYPITARYCVNLVVTDVAVIGVTDAGLVLKEYCPGWTVEDIQAITEPKLIVSEDLQEMTL